MEEDKYYIPSIKEFHIGFEYELYQPGTSTVYNKEVFDFSHISLIENIFDKHLTEGWLRVKYLDKEDIESLGFQESFDEPGEWWWSFKDDFDIQLYLNDMVGSSNQNPSLRIYNKKDDQVFLGFVKNKSELKVLLKQLGI